MLSHSSSCGTTDETRSLEKRAFSGELRKRKIERFVNRNIRFYVRTRWGILIITDDAFIDALFYRHYRRNNVSLLLCYLNRYNKKI